LGQVAHGDFDRPHDPIRIREGLNFYLRADHEAIRIVDAALVAEDFHARFDAKKRHYLYRILNRPAPSPLLAGRVWHVPHALDTAAMARAAQDFLGHHDFTSFRTVHCQAKHPMRSIDAIALTQQGDEIHMAVTAQSFLHHQIRNMMGTLRAIGLGKMPVDSIPRILIARDRAAAGQTAPAEGLYFVGVEY
jgi:tRNA pseudouridine38-40 synthase